MNPQRVPLEDLVCRRYPGSEWATIVELSGGVGATGYDSRADVVAFNCWPSKGWHRLAFEVKRTRADFMREVDNPMKRQWLEKHFHQCYFVVVPDIVKDDELPEGWGLLVSTKSGDKLIRRKAAMHREIGALPEALALSAIRALANNLQKERSLHHIFEGSSISKADLDAKVEERLAARREVIETEWQHVRKLHQTLSDRRSELEGPIGTLAKQAGKYGDIFGSWRQAPDKITSADVLKWVAHIRTHAAKDMMRKVWSARASLTELIDAAKAEGVDHGEPTSRQSTL